MSMNTRLLPQLLLKLERHLTFRASIRGPNELSMWVGSQNSHHSMFSKYCFGTYIPYCLKSVWVAAWVGLGNSMGAFNCCGGKSGKLTIIFWEPSFIFSSSALSKTRPYCSQPIATYPRKNLVNWVAISRSYSTMPPVATAQGPAQIMEEFMKSGQVIIFSKSYCPYCHKVSRKETNQFDTSQLTARFLSSRWKSYSNHWIRMSKLWNLI